MAWYTAARFFRAIYVALFCLIVELSFAQESMDMKKPPDVNHYIGYGVVSGAVVTLTDYEEGWHCPATADLHLKWIFMDLSDGTRVDGCYTVGLDTLIHAVYENGEVGNYPPYMFYKKMPYTTAAHKYNNS